MDKILDAIPSNWCDPLLTGRDAVIGKSPYDCQDIEKLLNGIRERIEIIVSPLAVKRKPTRQNFGSGLQKFHNQRRLRDELSESK